MTAVPTGTLKRVDDMGVFLITASFSIFAYIWMFIVLKVWSPDQIEIVEAVLTLLFFVILIVLAFVADKYNAYKKKKAAAKKIALGEEPEQSNKRATISKDDYYRIVGLQKDKDLMHRKPTKSGTKTEGVSSIHDDNEALGLIHNQKDDQRIDTEPDFLKTDIKNTSGVDLGDDYQELNPITLGFGEEDQGGDLKKDTWKVGVKQCMTFIWLGVYTDGSINTYWQLRSF